jgi:hypothetical protein
LSASNLSVVRAVREQTTSPDRDQPVAMVVATSIKENFNPPTDYRYPFMLPE